MGKHNLKKEMEVQKKIILEIQRKRLKAILEEEDAKNKERKKRYTKIIVWTFSGGSSLAIAAAIAILLVVAPMVNTMMQYSNDYATQITLEDSRGMYADDITTNINNIWSHLQHHEWEEAHALIQSTKSQLNINCASYKEQQNELEWQEVLCYMHDGKILKARRCLRKIARSDSFYNNVAQQTLIELTK